MKTVKQLGILVEMLAILYRIVKNPKYEHNIYLLLCELAYNMQYKE
jgi:hypothetical protein